MRLSQNFTLEEFTRSETAMKYGFKEQYAPPREVIDNLVLLATNIAEPIRRQFGSFAPTCAYRCERVNTAVKGERKSEHLLGKAMDETFIKGGQNISREVFDWLVYKSGLKWSKLILEFPDKNGVPRWLHIGYDTLNLNNQVMVAEKNAFGQKKYIDFFTSKYCNK